MDVLNIEDNLQKLYYDKNGKGFLANAKTLRELMIDEGYEVSYEYINQWLKLQENNQILQRQDKTKIIYPPITGPDGTYQCDLTFYSQYTRHNDMYHIILVFIEVSSRKAFCYALKNKDEVSVNQSYEQFLKDIDYKIVQLGSDNGPEFKNKTFKATDKKYNIDHYYAEPYDKHKMGLVERFNLTLRNKITKYMKTYKSLRWVDIFPQLVSNYNNTIHSSTGYKPNEVTPEIMNKIRENIAERKRLAVEFVHSFKIGDNVRLLKKKSLFAKGGNIYTKSVYTVKAIDKLAIIIVNESGKERRVKPYLLKLISEIQTAPDDPDIEKHDEKENAQVNRKVRRQRKEGFDGVDNVGNVVLDKRLQPTRQTRAKIQYPKVNDRVKVKFDNEYYNGTVRKITAEGYKINFDDNNIKSNKGNYKKNEVILLRI